MFLNVPKRSSAVVASYISVCGISFAVIAFSGLLLCYFSLYQVLCHALSLGSFFYAQICAPHFYTAAAQNCIGQRGLVQLIVRSLFPLSSLSSSWRINKKIKRLKFRLFSCMPRELKNCHCFKTIQ